MTFAGHHFFPDQSAMAPDAPAEMQSAVTLRLVMMVEHLNMSSFPVHFQLGPRFSELSLLRRGWPYRRFEQPFRNQRNLHATSMTRLRVTQIKVDLQLPSYVCLLIGDILPNASNTTSGVMGWRETFALNERNASFTAFMIAAGAPLVPASPMPFAPKADVLVNVCSWPISTSGISKAVGSK
jgi:hypothetical protein